MRDINLGWREAMPDRSTASAIVAPMVADLDLGCARRAAQGRCGRDDGRRWPS
jgi:hypothetical protein